MAPVNVDGILGPATLQFINAAEPDLFIETANCEAARIYKSLPLFDKFGGQWIRQLQMLSPVTLKGVCPELQPPSNPPGAGQARP